METCERWEKNKKRCWRQRGVCGRADVLEDKGLWGCEEHWRARRMQLVWSVYSCRHWQREARRKRCKRMTRVYQCYRSKRHHKGCFSVFFVWGLYLWSYLVMVMYHRYLTIWQSSPLLSHPLIFIWRISFCSVRFSDNVNVGIACDPLKDAVCCDLRIYTLLSSVKNILQGFIGWFRRDLHTQLCVCVCVRSRKSSSFTSAHKKIIWL